MSQKKPFLGIDVGKGDKFIPSNTKQVYVVVSKKPDATKEKITKEACTSGTNVITLNLFDALNMADIFENGIPCEQCFY